MLRKLFLIAAALLTLTGVRANPSTFIGPDSYPPGINPLTGLTVADPSVLNRRPIDVTGR